ncbi:transposase [Micromonospora sp. NPDC005220]|uniref:transposase n=1 Tax=Micromonospora sp. NPDC005220 TaxID=3155589 RepID=UPI0033A2B5E1
MLGLAGISEDQPLGRRNAPGHQRVTRSDGTQRLLATAHWDCAEVRDRLCEIVRSRVGECGALCVVEATFPKKGNRAVAVEHQFSVESRRHLSCQNALFLLAVAPDGNQFLIDANLYVPLSWASNRNRLALAGAPPTLAYKSKSEIASGMIHRALDAGFRPQQVYLSLERVDERALSGVLRDRRIPYVAIETFPGGPDPVGTPDARPAEHEQVQAVRQPWYSRRSAALPSRLPAHRSQTTEQSIRTVYHARAGRPVTDADLVRGVDELRLVERRWRQTRNEIRLGWYEVRSWRGWYRHMTLAMAVQIADELTHLA